MRLLALVGGASCLPTLLASAAASRTAAGGGGSRLLLDLSHTHTGPGGVPSLLETVRKAQGQGPVEVDVTECNLGDEGAKLLAEGGVDPVMLCLRANHITAAGAGILLRSLRVQRPQNLESLVLDFNPIGDGGVQSAVALLQDGAPSLRKLSLRFCDLGPSGCRSLASGMVKAAAAGGSEFGLHALHLSGNQLIGDEGARALAGAMRRGVPLTDLDLSRCGIGDDGAVFLAQALAAGARLSSLSLAYNRVGPAGAAALADALSDQRCGLRVLDLGSNPLGNEGAAALSEGLAASRTLKGLCLTSCELGCAGACAIAAGIACSSSLEALDLSGNKITLSAENAASSSSTATALSRQAGAAVVSSLNRLYNQLVDDAYQAAQPDTPAATPCGLVALGKSLRRTPSLRILRLAAIGMNVKDAKQLAAAIQWSPGLKVVDVSMNGVASDQGRGWILECLRIRDEGKAGEWGRRRPSSRQRDSDFDSDDAVSDDRLVDVGDYSSSDLSGIGSDQADEGSDYAPLGESDEELDDDEDDEFIDLEEEEEEEEDEDGDFS